MNGVFLNRKHPVQEVSLLTFSRVPVDIPLHFLNHLLAKFVLWKKSNNHKTVYSHDNKKLLQPPLQQDE